MQQLYYVSTSFERTKYIYLFEKVQDKNKLNESAHADIFVTVIFVSAA